MRGLSIICIVLAIAFFGGSFAEQHKMSDKEVLFGDDMDEDELNQLSESEQKERLKSLAEKKMDANKDGYVDRSELEAWALKSMTDYETHESKEEFISADIDEDEHLTWREFLDETYGVDFNEDDEELVNPADEDWNSFANLFRREKEMFAAADGNSDGKLDMQEFLAFKHPNQQPKTGDLLIKHTLEQSDTNGNGQIELDEVMNEYHKGAGEEDPDWAIYEKERFTYELDVNKDGALTGQEILHWVTVNNKEASEDEATHLIGECDVDGDDKLSIDEIVNNHLIWIESEATDFGAHLLKNHDEL